MQPRERVQRRLERREETKAGPSTGARPTNNGHRSTQPHDSSKAAAAALDAGGASTEGGEGGEAGGVVVIAGARIIARERDGDGEGGGGGSEPVLSSLARPLRPLMHN